MIDYNDMKCFRSKLRIFEREIINQLKSETECCGVTLPQCHIIMELDIHGETSIKELSDILELDKSTLSRTIDSMVLLGFINRIENKDDRRFLKVSLTKKGIEKAKYINDMCNEYYNQVFSEIPETKHKNIIENVSLLIDSMKNINKKCCGKNCCK
jgi:DNA-binding MarR family transcriptional regulator